MTDHFARWAAGRLLDEPARPCPYSAEHAAAKLIEHRVDALISDRLDHTGFEGAVRADLQETRSDRLVQEMAREAALHKIADLAKAMSQEFIVLKGVGLAHVYYDQPHHRPSGDIDVFVPRGAFEDTAAALLGMDYEVLHALPGRLVSHALTLTPKEHGPRIDLHRRLSIRPEVSLALGFESLDDRSYPMPRFEGLRVPDAVDQLCHAALYVLARHEERDFTLIHAWDVKLLLESLGTFPRTLIRRRVGESLSRAIAWYCQWVISLFSLDIEVPEGSLPASGNWRHEMALYSWMGRMRGARQLVLPSPAYMRSTGRGATPKAYASRLMRGLITGRSEL